MLARNVKIITTDGRVTLRGPVDSTEEKRTIGEVIVMSKKSVFCISTSREQADRIIGQMIGILPDKAREVFPGPPGHRMWWVRALACFRG
ncbi:MAG: hypothetical protein KJ072_23805 [Verrucomicrobia bacterium]|nr:hypothetical protein [Verrucomicrobiota bacterium]